MTKKLTEEKREVLYGKEEMRQARLAPYIPGLGSYCGGLSLLELIPTLLTISRFYAALASSLFNVFYANKDII
jgi:hypothetical protein